VIPSIGRTERRVALALLLVAVVPLLAAMGLAAQTIHNVSQTAFQPEFEQRLDRSLGVYADLVKSMKHAMRSEGGELAASASLRAAAQEDGGGALARELTAALGAHPTLHSLRVENADGDELGARARAKPFDEKRYRAFTVQKPLGPDDDAPTATMVFLAERARLDEMQAAHEFVQGYKQIARDNRESLLDRPYLTAFGVLLGLTVALAVVTGVMVVRPATRRINELAAATKPVADGDLSVRVDASGRDEIAALAHAFNHMLEAVDQSRARIEFLKRVGEWQNMARRLAHEIKNPLTPIQLAVEECHRRYPGHDDGYTKLLNETLDIVREEVASLRRLVGEFAEFARLPRAVLQPGDVAEFLREQQPRLRLEDAVEGDGDDDAPAVEFDIDGDEMPVAFDRTMLYRVLSNLVSNAAQALEGGGQVRVSARRVDGHCELGVEDDGPGIDATLRPTVFDPYVTTKKEGTGLGLTIVKKVVIDHGGRIDVDASSLGGALFRIRLPLLGTSASDAALEQSDAAPLSRR
jgi:nitrogen fixation/metabolism regulation signal transduction histidine kinase